MATEGQAQVRTTLSNKSHQHRSFGQSSKFCVILARREFCNDAAVPVTMPTLLYTTMRAFQRGLAPFGRAVRQKICASAGTRVVCASPRCVGSPAWRRIATTTHMRTAAGTESRGSETTPPASAAGEVAADSGTDSIASAFVLQAGAAECRRVSTRQPWHRPALDIFASCPTTSKRSTDEPTSPLDSLIGIRLPFGAWRASGTHHFQFAAACATCHLTTFRRRVTMFARLQSRAP